MKKLCKKHHLAQEHKLCKSHFMEHGPKICDSHRTALAKSEEDPSEKDGCPYCQEINQQEDNCPYCAELNQNDQGDMDDCPMCQQMDEESCPYCDELNSESEPQPEQTGLAVEDMGDQRSVHPENCPECQKLYGDAVENQPGQTAQEPPRTQGHETAEEVLAMLDSETPQDPNAKDAAKQIDNTEMPQGDAMEENASVPENFGEAQKEDISDEERQVAGDGEEDSPNMGQVLQSGLDDHAQEQKRAQVIDLVGHTLQGFKANKDALEAAKAHSPGLYQSTLQMLKAMIALCDLLGLKPLPQQEAPQAQEQAPQEQPQAEAAPQEGAAQGPKQ